MTGTDLRPLTLGEILDRTFTLYRRHFPLFIGLTFFPQLLVLAVNLGRTFWFKAPLTRTAASLAPGALLSVLLGGFLFLVVVVLANLFAQAGTILAVTELYLGRATGIAECLRRAWGKLATVFGTGLLSGLAVLVGCLLLIVPGVFLFCRLFVAVPAAIIEDRSPAEALSRSWHLVKQFTWRSFLLIVLYFAIALAAQMLISLPFGIATVMLRGNASALQFWNALTLVGNTLVTIVVSPILLISTAVFYFDLRVRKEAFDLQFMMDPTSERSTPPGDGTVPSIL